MLKITIDGTQIEVEPGTTVIQAADKVGIDIPRYCYHPGLKIVGVCRICLVEIERMPKLQVACYTPVADGMVVHTNSPQVLEARQAVMEFLLVNHPLDCPVCDQAGECWLQNFYMEHARHDSLMFEDKVKKSKAVPIGPNVMLDSERCILCSRCVRFCDDITGTSELGIFNRGDHAELLPYPGRELDNNYSGNTIDICPVGALTDRDFRFKTRVWYLSETPSICPGCSTGCNINIHHNDRRSYKADGARVARLKPRYNAEVNEWWMCDAGRYGFTYVDDDSRLQVPLRRDADGRQDMTWGDILPEMAGKLRSIIAEHGANSVGVILSPQLTNEDLFVARRFFSQQLGIRNIDFEAKPTKKAGSDNFLMREDKNPNTLGAETIGVSAVKMDGKNVEEMLQAAAEGKLKGLYIFGHDLTRGFSEKLVEDALAGVELSIFQGSNQNPVAAVANYVLPTATFVEKDGTFTNAEGRVQKINKAVEPLGESKSDWEILKLLAKHLGQSMPYFESEDVFNALAAEVADFAHLNYGNIGGAGAELNTEPKTRKVKVA